MVSCRSVSIPARCAAELGLQWERGKGGLCCRRKPDFPPRVTLWPGSLGSWILMTLD